MKIQKKKNPDKLDKSNYVLQKYLNEIQQFKLLGLEEELEYSRRIEQGDQDALNALVNANLRLVVKIARSYAKKDMALMDIIQEGNIGLMRAAERFDYRKNNRFSTYASCWIKQSIGRALSNQLRAIRLPHRKELASRRLRMVSDDFFCEFSRNPTIDELVDYSGMRRNEVLSVINSVNAIVSLDSEIQQDKGTLLDLIEDYSYSPDQQLICKSFKEDTQRFLSVLREQEKTVLVSRFAFDGGEKETLRTIGGRMGISPERVRQIELRALKKLREQCEPVREYIYN